MLFYNQLTNYKHSHYSFDANISHIYDKCQVHLYLHRTHPIVSLKRAHIINRCNYCFPDTEYNHIFDMLMRHMDNHT